MPYLKDKIEWFDEIVGRLREEPKHGHVWSDGDEILCRTEDVADALADMIRCMYGSQGESIVVITGYYDPVEDERNGETDKYTGWWYVYTG